MGFIKCLSGHKRAGIETKLNEELKFAELIIGIEWKGKYSEESTYLDKKKVEELIEQLTILKSKIQ